MWGERYTTEEEGRVGLKKTFNAISRSIVKTQVMEKVKVISEAFSMQPVTLMVGQQKCTEINLEKICIGKPEGCPQEEMFYVGYDENKNKLFQYLARAVNVHYF